jgi:phosphatidyl-myo-inositol dimannoside synthase
MTRPAGAQTMVVALFPQLLGMGGIQTAGRETAAALVEICHASRTTTTNFSLNDPSGEQSFEAEGQIVSFRGFGRAKGSFAASTARHALCVKTKTPLVILAFHPNLAPITLLAMAFTPRAKIITVSHGVDVWTPLPFLRRYALRKGDLALAPSHFTCNALQATQGVTEGKIWRVPWPMPSATLQLASQSSTLPCPDGFPKGRVALSVARWSASERYKGADELISAAAQLRQEFSDLQLVFAGGGDDVPRLKDLARTSGAGDCVHFLGEISDQELAGCYARAEIFALPSTGEGFGFVFLEAMAFGKPVIAARAGGATDIVENDVNGLLVPPGDLPALKDALGRLFRDDALRIRLGQRAAGTVRREFSFPSFVERLKAILNEVGVP